MIENIGFFDEKKSGIRSENIAFHSFKLVEHVHWVRASAVIVSGFELPQLVNVRS